MEISPELIAVIGGILVAVVAAFKGIARLTKNKKDDAIVDIIEDVEEALTGKKSDD